MTKSRLSLLLIPTLLGLIGCEPPATDPDIDLGQLREDARAAGWEMTLPTPADPAMPPASPELVEMGDDLFHEGRLRLDGVSCASCHTVNGGYSLERQGLGRGSVHGVVIPGEEADGQNVMTPTHHGVAYNHNGQTLHDGSGSEGGDLLEPVQLVQGVCGQVAKALNGHNEFSTDEEVKAFFLKRLAELYGERFDSLGLPLDSTGIAIAIDCFERSPANSPLNSNHELFMRGDDSALRFPAGLANALRANCQACHTSPNGDGPVIVGGIGTVDLLGEPLEKVRPMPWVELIHKPAHGWGGEQVTLIDYLVGHQELPKVKAELRAELSREELAAVSSWLLEDRHDEQLAGHDHE